MQTIYLVRHGETNANVAGQWQDGEEALSERGHLQARHVAERLRELPFDRVFSSDMRRARETTETIMKHHAVDVVYSNLLAERQVPSSTVGAINEPIAGNPAHEFLQAWQAAGADPDFRYEDEETVREIVERASAALTLLGESGGAHILVVTHGTILRTIINTVLQGSETGGPYTIFGAGRYMQTTNTGLSVLVRADAAAPWQVLTYNDHAHFADN